MMEKADFYDFFRKIPKAELHLHIEAVISFGSINKFYMRKFPGIGKDEAAREIKKLFTYDNLDGFIQAYLQIQELYESVADFDLIFSDLKDYIVRNGISYVEVFAAPSAFVKKGFDFSAMVESYRRNVRKVKEETGVDVRILIDVSRTFGAENAEKNLQLLLANRIPEIIGIGLGGSESKGPCRDFGAVFEKARDNGLFTVAHAGEDVDAFSIWDAIDILKVSRVGHGVTAFQDEALMKELVRRGIALESCPMSNVFTKRYVKSLSEHPLRKFFDEGIMVTLNTDDPLFFGVELVDEYWNAYSQMGFSAAELKEIVKNSFRASFLDESRKARFCAAVDEAWG